MKPAYFQLMNDATRLTRNGDLQAATAAIQAALQGGGAEATPRASPHDVIDVQAREVRSADVHADAVAGGGDAPVAGQPAPSPGVPPSPGAEQRHPTAGGFITGSHSEAGRQHDYKLYIPRQAGERALPLVVMLHGCTQNPDDFAAGTGMNTLAESQGFYVLYPAQSQKANPQRCWNWFKHSHQQRGRGEPAWLASMTRKVMAQHCVDPARVFVAGLSAGGAMAAVLGEAYPDLFAAVGVHSGLAAGTATDLQAALAAMRSGAARPRHASSGVPTIVFHGDADGTVHASNGEHVIAASVGAAATVEQQAHTDASRRATRHVHRGADGRVLGEHWVVHGGPHAWSGGSSQGSYTDSRGPNASEEMLRFFNEHPRRPAASI